MEMNVRSSETLPVIPDTRTEKNNGGNGRRIIFLREGDTWINSFEIDYTTNTNTNNED